jgi:hypothetical protein
MRPRNRHDALTRNTDRLEPSFPSGQLGTSLFHRRFAFLSLNQEVRARPYDVSAELPNPYLGSLHMQVSFLKKGFETPETYDTAEMAQVFLQSFDGHILGKDQVRGHMVGPNLLRGLNCPFLLLVRPSVSISMESIWLLL